MKALTLLLVLVSGWAVQNTLACSEDGKSGFLPENTLRIPVGMKSAQGGLSEAQFNAVISKVEKIYSPVASQMKAKLVIERLWSNEKVNAAAMRPEQNVWNVQMYGGLARHASVTEDGFALVLCHELGHHIGGAPKYRSLAKPWASSEGQSDYFATLKCLRHVFLNDNNEAIVKKMSVPVALSAACKKAHSKDDANICIRTGMAGVSVAALFSFFDHSKASFTTPDTTEVAKNFDEHPATQCRLDTFFQGSICEASFNEDVSQKDEVQGTCHGVLGHKQGLRPRCWHKPITR